LLAPLLQRRWHGTACRHRALPVRARARERKHDEPYKEPPGSSSEATLPGDFEHDGTDTPATDYRNENHHHNQLAQPSFAAAQQLRPHGSCVNDDDCCGGGC
jgi:hypothetical protein